MENLSVNVNMWWIRTFDDRHYWAGDVYVNKQHVTYTESEDLDFLYEDLLRDFADYKSYL